MKGSVIWPALMNCQTPGWGEGTSPKRERVREEEGGEVGCVKNTLYACSRVSHNIMQHIGKLMK